MIELVMLRLIKWISKQQWMWTNQTINKENLSKNLSEKQKKKNFWTKSDKKFKNYGKFESSKSMFDLCISQILFKKFKQSQT